MEEYCQSDFKIHLADVRNQDDTVRDSGDATFRLCDNIANTGRDAPRHLRAGSVYDEYEVSGLFVYATSGHKDPLLYAHCVIDLFSDPSDGTSLKDVRHVCTTHNSSENVAAGSVGNSGNVGPVGFTNDPQVISYQPQIFDGATDILDWSGRTQTVASASNPVSSGCAGNAFQGSTSLTIPGSTGANIWFSGMGVRYSTIGTALGGLAPGHLYWVFNCLTEITGGASTNTVALMNTPLINSQVTLRLTSLSQGTGNDTFTLVMWHPHHQAWVDEDTSADENWATRGSTARFTRRIYPAFTSAEKLYWEETGLVPPINTSQPTPTVQMSYGGSDEILAYNPFSKMNVIGGDQGGSGRISDLSPNGSRKPLSTGRRPTGIGRDSIRWLLTFTGRQRCWTRRPDASRSSIMGRLPGRAAMGSAAPMGLAQTRLWHSARRKTGPTGCHTPGSSTHCRTFPTRSSIGAPAFSPARPMHTFRISSACLICSSASACFSR
jgi:hypothetical protein